MAGRAKAGHPAVTTQRRAGGNVLTKLDIRRFGRHDFRVLDPLPQQQWKPVRWCSQASGATMRRRDFIKAVVTSAAAWPISARAQQVRIRRVGLILGLAENDPEASARVKAFRLGLRDLEWIEGRNIHIDNRFAGSNLELVNKHVAELVRSQPEVIVANTTPVMKALKPATNTIPIVFVVVNDPVGQGFIPNLKQPGGNITGYS